MSKSNFEQNKWIYSGLIWGALMFIIMQLILPYAQGELITTRGLLLGIVIWSLGGLAWGYTMKGYNNRARNKVK